MRDVVEIGMGTDAAEVAEVAEEEEEEEEEGVGVEDTLTEALLIFWC